MPTAGPRGTADPVGTEDPTGRPQVFLRPIGTPLPLAMVGLAVATAVLSSLNLGWIPVAEQHQVGLVLFAFAFPLQVVAMVLLFLARDAPAGAGTGVLSVTWLSLGLLLYLSPPGKRSATVAVLLFASAAALAPSVATMSLAKMVPAAVMGMAGLRYVLTGVWEKVGGTGWEHAAGWEGVVLAALALYAAFASDLEGMLHHSVLPLGRRGKGLAAVRLDLRQQVPELDREPGVRPQT